MYVLINIKTSKLYVVPFYCAILILAYDEDDMWDVLGEL
jgi:hypothetical protein